MQLLHHSQPQVVLPSRAEVVTTGFCKSHLHDSAMLASYVSLNANLLHIHRTCYICCTAQRAVQWSLLIHRTMLTPWLKGLETTSACWRPRTRGRARMQQLRLMANASLPGTRPRSTEQTRIHRSYTSTTFITKLFLRFLKQSGTKCPLAPFQAAYNALRPGNS